MLLVESKGDQSSDLASTRVLVTTGKYF